MRVCGKRVDTGAVVTVSLERERIAAVEPGQAGADLGGREAWLSPGFLDLQLNGYRGADFNRGGCHAEATGSGEADPHDPVEAFAPIFAAAARAGTSLFCPTIVTNSHEAMAGNLRRLARALDATRGLDRRVAGIHVEGPYLSSEDGPRGAHTARWIRDPDWEEFQRFQEAAGGRIRMVTLAPERPGALPFIQRLVDAGVTAALGHTGAESETIRDAVRAGATVSTHLGNGAHAQIRRHPNYIWEQLACDDLAATIIADGHHLPASVVKSIARVKGPQRLALVSDAISLGGLPPGIYSDGRHEVLSSGKVVVRGTPYLVGAAHLLDRCVANVLRFTDFSLGEECRCVTSTPARLLGLQERKGRLEEGYDADLTLFRLSAEGEVEVVETISAGERLL